MLFAILIQRFWPNIYDIYYNYEIVSLRKHCFKSWVFLDSGCFANIFSDYIDITINYPPVLNSMVSELNNLINNVLIN